MNEKFCWGLSALIQVVRFTFSTRNRIFGLRYRRPPWNFPLLSRTLFLAASCLFLFLASCFLSLMSCFNLSKVSIRFLLKARERSRRYLSCRTYRFTAARSLCSDAKRFSSWSSWSMCDPRFFWSHPSKLACWEFMIELLLSSFIVLNRASASLSICSLSFVESITHSTSSDSEWVCSRLLLFRAAEVSKVFYCRHRWLKSSANEVYAQPPFLESSWYSWELLFEIRLSVFSSSDEESSN